MSQINVTGMLEYSMKFARADSHVRIRSFPTFRELISSPSLGFAGGLVAPPAHSEDGEGFSPRKFGKTSRLDAAVYLRKFN
jgi:hypothetical protein